MMVRNTEMNLGDIVWKLLQLTMGVLVSVGTWFSGMAYRRMEEHSESIHVLETRMAVVEGTRFSSSDGLKIWDKIHEIEKRNLESQNSPPGWWTERIGRIESRLDKIDAKLESAKVN